MSVRQLMAAVALIALAMVPLDLLRRSSDYTRKAERYETRAEGARIRRKADDKFAVFKPEMFDADGNIKENHAIIFDALEECYGKLGRKYRHAASHPWETVEPDPPLLRLDR